MKEIPIKQNIAYRRGQLNIENFKIRTVQDLVQDNEVNQALHRHNFYFILVLKKGKGYHEIDFIPYTDLNNIVFFMRPGQVHKLNLKKGSTGYLLEFNNEFYNPKDNLSAQRLRKVSSQNYCQIDIERFNKIYSILGFIFQEYSNKNEGYKYVIESYLDILFIELVRQSRNPKNLFQMEKEYKQERLEELLELIENNISTNKQVSDYTDMMNLSLFQLNAITKSALGKTCSELINEYIILESKRYLLSTTNQVNQIAYHLGYEDISYFIRFFKKHTGYSPTSFRENFK